MKVPLWIAFWIILLEIIVVIALIPSQWMQDVIDKEAINLTQQMGVEEAEWVHAKALTIHKSTLYDSGLYAAVYNFLIPTKNQEIQSGSPGMGAAWFNYAKSRLVTLSIAYYHVLSRYTLLITWAPYFIILLVPSAYDGYATWSIKKTNYSYTSPLVHRYSAIGIFISVVLLVGLFLAPFFIQPILIPIIIMLICILFGLMLGNAQKRM